MARQKEPKKRNILGDEKGPAEYFNEATSGITPDSFIDAFRTFAPVQDVKVTRRKLEGLYRIADDFLRHKSAMRP